MIENALIWMNEHYPEGFFCCDLIRWKHISWIDVVSLNCPLLVHLKTSAMQDLITCLIEAGASAATPCSHIVEPPISGTLGDIAIKVRASGLDELNLVVIP
jgi:hypothetical protein